MTTSTPVIDMPPVVLPPPVETKLDREIRAFQQLLPELLKAHRGRYVAVHDGRVVGEGDDQIAVAKKAYAEFGYLPILVRQVTDTPRVVSIPSVFVTRRG